MTIRTGNAPAPEQSPVPEGGISAGQLAYTAPSLAVLTVAIGLRALLAIASASLSARLAPRISREAELKLLDAATQAELSAYDNPGYNDRWDAADRGVEVSRNLLTQVQYILVATASLIASACVLTVQPERQAASLT